MGYEITVFIGRVHDTQPGLTEKDSVWFQIAASVETSKAGGFLADLRTKNDPFVYLYAIAGDGDTEVTEDRYGERLVAVPIAKVLPMLTPEAMVDSQRLPWLKAVLEAAPESWATHVVLFGH